MFLTVFMLNAIEISDASDNVLNSKFGDAKNLSSFLGHQQMQLPRIRKVQ